MDAITHGLVGALIARLGPTEKLGGSATAVCAVSAVLPDLDYALLLAGPGAYYCHHREATHSLVAGIVLATIVAAIATAATGKKAFGTFWGLALAGFLSHILLDALTPFGTLAFFPFSDRRLAGDVLCLVDPFRIRVFVDAPQKRRARVRLWDHRHERRLVERGVRHARAQANRF